MRRCPHSPGRLPRVEQSPGRGFPLVQEYSGTAQPRGRCRMSPIHQRECQCWAAAQGWVWGAPNCQGWRHHSPQIPHRRRWGQQVELPRTSGSRTHLARAEGLQVGRGARRSQAMAQQKVGAGGPQELALTAGVPAPAPGKRLPRCPAWQEPPAPAGSSAPPAELPAHFLRPRPVPSTAAALDGIPALPLPAPRGPAELPANAKPHAEERNQPWGSHTPVRGSRQGQ